jgi:hypothetical protein
MFCNCNNYLIRDISIKANFLLIKTDKLIAIHKSEIKKMHTRKATCNHDCGNQYLYLVTPSGEIGMYMKDKTYEELLLYILELFETSKTNNDIFKIPAFDINYFKGFYDDFD